MKIAVCNTNPTHSRFRAMATVREEWIVDRSGNFSERTNDGYGHHTDPEVIEEPNPHRDDFYCAVCDDYEPTLVMNEEEFEEYKRQRAMTDTAFQFLLKAAGSDPTALDQAVDIAKSLAKLNEDQLNALCKRLTDRAAAVKRGGR